MDWIDALISEGKQLIDNYNNSYNTDAFSSLKGVEYETWMSKVVTYAEQMSNSILKDELLRLYKQKNKYLGVMLAEKVIGILQAIKSSVNDIEGELQMKILISHSSEDKKYADAILLLLKGLGLNREDIIYTSNDLYGIPLGMKIFDYLRDNINADVHIIFLLSNNYFKSIACMNEMGATWVTGKEHTIIGIPDFDFDCQEWNDCCIDSKEMGFLINNYIRITELKNRIEEEFGKKIDDMEWQVLLDDYKKILK